METKTCQNCKSDFVIEPEDFVFYEKIKVPAPTFCPECRRMRRLSWRNDTSLYSRECSICEKKFISIYAPNSGFKVLCPKCFHSDKWDPYDYGMEYDNSKPFLDQWYELFKKIPKLGIVNDNDISSTNCLYTNDFAYGKNCAMVFIAWKVENVYNSMSLAAGKDLSDFLATAEESTFSYDGVCANGVAYCKSIYWSSSCINCIFCYDLRGCSDCFMSTGLRNKKFYFKNIQYSKDEYKKILDSYKLETRSGYKKARKEFEEFIKDKPRQYAELRNCVNCTGSDMINAKNTKNSSFASFSEDSKYVHNGVTFITCYDCEVGGETEQAYECITPDHSYMSLVTIESWKNTFGSYSYDCHSSNNILGCVGIKKGEYVILNKRYSKEDYEVLYKQIVEEMKKKGEWGEFFPKELSPFGINETRAVLELDLNKEIAIEKGFNWQDGVQETRGKETIEQGDVPDSILDCTDSICEEALACTNCTRNYRILPDEFLLYQRLKVPIPEECFFCRNNKRQKMRGGYNMNERVCECESGNHDHTARCENKFQTFFTEKENRPIFCESCYQKELN